ncbi:MAG: prepilin-type N-terminal cleavage/methylation domain-containing protein [Planctomycetota bacterium]
MKVTSARGFSLLEVILALAILGGAIAVLGELSRLGMRSAEHARDLTQAQLLSESKLAEITSGLTPPEPEQGVPCEPIDEEEGDEPEWHYSVEVTSVGEEGLLEVRVTVTKDLPTEQKPVEFTLVRWMVESSGASEGSLVTESGSL